jgi:uncharacterized lipoprotein YddW (UPF0748 family)
MKFSNKTTIILFFLFVTVCHLVAQSPKREMRATWLTTVWAIDFPKNSGAANQKAELTRMLDSIQNTRLNAIFFQVRSRCDAFYNSSYEPWSTDLGVARGTDPGWDPLAFAIEECHKRGIECHAWINPYRYATTAEGWTGSNATPKNYQVSNPDWLLYYPARNYWILDPGIPAVRTQIKKVIGEIINNYDVDGIIFDDYFYSYGGTSDQDANTQALYKPAGKDVKDWRRENVNKMIAEVYDTIQDIKPWLTFGVSPFGIWTTDASVAAKEGIALPPGITGGNMYAEIYCDPLAWLKEGTVDYISPQLYWRSGGSQDYTKLCPWWSNLANRFGKHFYSSQSTSNFASDFTEMSLQIVYNRASNKDNAPGSVFYNTSSWWNYTAFKNHFRSNLFTHKALPPAVNWKEYTEKQSPQNIRIESSQLKWDSPLSNVRYSVYAIPNSELLKAGNFANSKYLLGISWTNSFDLTKYSNLVATHKFGVAVLDRYGNEFAPALMGYTPVANQAANLQTPLNGGGAFSNMHFQWEAVVGAEYYVIEFSKSADFSSVFYRMDVDVNRFDISNLYIQSGTTYYWRVRTRKIGVLDAVSEIRSFSILSVQIQSPTPSQTGVSISPKFEWLGIAGVDSYTIQLSESSNFATIRHEITGVTSNSYQLSYGVLTTNKTYYIRIKAHVGESSSAWSEVVAFTTETTLPSIPTFIYPLPNSTLDVTSGMPVKVETDYFATSITIQLNLRNTFSVFTNIQKTLEFAQYESIVDGLMADTLYYVRARANYSTGSTEWTSPFTIRTRLGTNINQPDYGFSIYCATVIQNNNHFIQFDLPFDTQARISLMDLNGRVLNVIDNSYLHAGHHQYEFETNKLSRGMYLLTFESKQIKRTLKLIKTE